MLLEKYHIHECTVKTATLKKLKIILLTFWAEIEGFWLKQSSYAGSLQPYRNRLSGLKHPVFSRIFMFTKLYKQLRISARVIKNAIIVL